MTHVTCKLTAKNRDQLRNPTLSNRAWATFFTTEITFPYIVDAAAGVLKLDTMHQCVFVSSIDKI